MTEEEWLASEDPAWMLEFLKGKASDRKLWLFTVACCRRKGILSEYAEATLKLAERSADGLGTIEEVRASLEILARESNSHDGAGGWSMEFGSFISESAHDGAFFSVMGTAFGDGNPFGHTAVWPGCCDYLRCLFGKECPPAPRKTGWLKVVAVGLVGLFVGDPFRATRPSPDEPVPAPIADPSWLTSTVLALAHGMYESRDFSAMPILADALQDAGCENIDVLDHCRNSSPHVRGCWVVDLVLGKSY